jgi:hypothetical protein
MTPGAVGVPVLQPALHPGLLLSRAPAFVQPLPVLHLGRETNKPSHANTQTQRAARGPVLPCQLSESVS